MASAPAPAPALDLEPDRLLAPPAVRAFYLAASAIVLIVQALPPLRDRFLAYGSRATSSAPENPSRQRPTAVGKVLDYAASLQVPHNYFTHFYVVSVASSIFWAWRLRLWDTTGQLPVVWALMLLQGMRRLLESYAYTSSSKSKMWFVHWILGLLFYLATNVAIWTEQLSYRPSPHLTQPSADPLEWKTAILVPLILAAQVLQHIYHAYLYRLRTQNTDYQIPSHRLFPNLLCPHYTCDIAVYALLSLLAAPMGHVVNWTLVTTTIFVAVNLSVTAAGTKTWYVEKFGEDKVRGRKRIYPWVW